MKQIATCCEGRFSYFLEMNCSGGGVSCQMEVGLKLTVLLWWSWDSDEKWGGQENICLWHPCWTVAPFGCSDFVAPQMLFCLGSRLFIFNVWFVLNNYIVQIRQKWRSSVAATTGPYIAQSAPYPNIKPVVPSRDWSSHTGTQRCIQASFSGFRLRIRTGIVCN